MEVEEELACLCLIQKLKKRQYWVHPILRDRLTHGQFVKHAEDSILLLFLKLTTPGKERQSNFSNDTETDVDMNNGNDNDEMPPPANKGKPNPSDDQFIKILEKSENTIKPEPKCLRAKIGIYNLIAQYQTSSHSPLASNYSSENYWWYYYYTTGGRDTAPATPSSVSTSNEDSYSNK
ncbi:unnamed protein product [Pieris brassicae]|uniref:Uncharacterized protein n=1 Tax=Pieris brassicae TaxID=7116 RepID=A0A9P0XGV5_PIEBR|nr:unnamed protein product [Pieris brassicae]